MAYFFDSYAIIEILLNKENYKTFQNEPIISNALHISEVYYSFLRTAGKDKADQRINKLKALLLEITREIAIEAALFKFQHKSKELSYADCLGYITALKNNLVFLTGDPGFEHMPNVEFVK